MGYYTLMQCPHCEHENYSLGFNGIDYKGRPVFDIDMFTQSFETCEKCGCEFGYGDCEPFYEEPEEEEEEEEEED